MAYKIPKLKVKKAVEDSNGTYTSVARNLKVKSSLTAKKHVEKYPDLLELFYEIQDTLCDTAENALMENLMSNNELVKARSAEFVLKNLPRSRFRDAESEDVQVTLARLLERMMDNTSPDK